jgi:hypothetical protein
MAGIFDIFSTDAAEKAAAAQKAAIQKGFQGATDLIGTGQQDLRTAYGGAQNYLAPLGTTATSGFNLFGDITGAGGVEGQQRAQNLFYTDPGYQWQQDEAARAIMRNQAGTGQLASGNTLSQLASDAQNRAGAGYNQWAQRALALAGMAPGIAGQQAGIETGLGDRLLASQTGLGQLKYGAETAQGQADAAAALDANRAAGQFWDTALGIGKLAAGVYTGNPALFGGGAKPGGWTGWNPNVSSGWNAG